MAFTRKYVSAFVGLALLLLAFIFFASMRRGPLRANDLSVVFVGLTNDPKAQMVPARIEAPQSATGLCALFLITNANPSRHVRFHGISVKQKTERGWQPYVPTNEWSKEWTGVGDWSPGYGCLFAVAWPPGLPTNKSWRINLRTATEPVEFCRRINNALGREIFAPTKEQDVLSSEVIP